MSDFHKGSPKEHSCETMSESIHWFMKRSCLKVLFYFFAIAATLFNGAEWFEGHLRNLPVKLFYEPSTDLAEVVLSFFF